MFRSLRHLSRTVWLIGLISLVNDSATEMVYPLVPLYLSSVLMAGPRALGLIEGIAEATSSLLKLFSGVFVDRTRRVKPWIVFGYGLAGAGRPLVAFATSWPWLLLIRFADRVGKGLRTSPRDALLAASVGPGQRGLAFGLHRAMDNAGAVVGPMTAAALLALGVGMREVFLWALVPAGVCLALTLTLRDPPDRERPARLPFDWRMRDMPAGFKRYLFVVAIFTLGNSSNMFLLLRARELGVPTAEVPLLWAGVSAVAMMAATPLSALSDRVERRWLLAGGYVAYAMCYIAIGALTHAGPVLVAVFCFYGLFFAATEGVEKALVADLAPPGQQGTAFGWFNLTTGATLLPASLIFGWLYERTSAGTAFASAGGFALMAAILLVTWARPVGSR